MDPTRRCSRCPSPPTTRQEVPAPRRAARRRASRNNPLRPRWPLPRLWAPRTSGRRFVTRVGVPPELSPQRVASTPCSSMRRSTSPRPAQPISSRAPSSVERRTKRRLCELTGVRLGAPHLAFVRRSWAQLLLACPAHGALRGSGPFDAAGGQTKVAQPDAQRLALGRVPC